MYNYGAFTRQFTANIRRRASGSRRGWRYYEHALELGYSFAGVPSIKFVMYDWQCCLLTKYYTRSAVFYARRVLHWTVHRRAAG